MPNNQETPADAEGVGQPKREASLAAPNGYAPVLVVPTETPDKVLAELRAAGYVPIAAKDPSKVAVVTPCSRLIGDDLLMAAMHGLSGEHASSERSRMMLELFRRMKAREAHTAKMRDAGESGVEQH